MAEADIMVGLSAMTIASGLCDGSMARITLVLHPCSTATGPQRALAQWPGMLEQVRGTDSSVGLLLAPGRAIPAVCPTSVDVSIPDLPDRTRIQELWRRMLIPTVEGVVQPDWADFAKVFDVSCNPQPARPSTVITPPHSEAALAYGLLRGRALLDAIAGPDAPILAMQTGRGPTRFTANRPWLGRNQPDIQLASLGADALPHPHAWLRPYQEATADLFEGRSPVPLFPAPRQFAQAALGQNDGMDGIIDRIQAGHHYATPAQPSSPTIDDVASIAQRRIGALMALPVLQRLFGLAHDVCVETDTLRRHADADGYLVLALAADPRCWTLARLTPTSFAPASAHSDSNPESFQGLRNLGQTAAGGGPRYDLCTMDPVLAAESDLALSQSGADNPARIPDLRNGGLRLLDRDRLLDAAATAKSAEATHAAATACVKQGASMLKTAEELSTGDTLLIGIQQAAGISWRVPQYRHVTYRDPMPKSGDWVEDVLAAIGLPRGGVRRMTLDCASLQQPTMKLPNPETHSDVRADGQRWPRESPAELDRRFAADEQALLADATLASWGGEPMGVTPSYHTQNSRQGTFKPKQVDQVRNELDITREFSAPGDGDERIWRSPILRFGFAYHVALSRTYIAGAGLGREEAAAVLAIDPTLALPPVPDAAGRTTGRRMLRHEPVHAPSVAFPRAHLHQLERTSPRQDGPDMIVRTGRVGPLDTSRRILLAPEVPLAFAALHDVLPAATAPRRNGLRRFIIARPVPAEGNAKRPITIAAGTASGQVFMPDPAAHTLVLRLRRPDRPGDTAEDGLGERPWLEDPVALPLAGSWPDTTPVEIVLATTSRPKPGASRMALDLEHRLGPVGEPVASDDPDASARVPRVTISLAPGEEVVLEAWFVPTETQIARWFDCIETAAILATEAGAADAPSGPAAACVAGLRALLGILPPAPSVPTGAAQPVCTGAAALPAAPPAQLRQLAAVTHRRMLLHPVPVIAVPLPMRLTHATDQQTVPAASFAADPMVVRRLVAPDGGLLAFLQRGPKDWTLRDTEPDATGALIGGTLRCDLAATAAIVIEGYCLAPDTDELDLKGVAGPAAQRWPFELLRIDGLPQPADARAGLRELDLSELMAAALGPARPMGAALRAAFSGKPATRGARHLSLRVTALGRHAGLMPAPPGSDEAAAKDAATVHNATPWSKLITLPATLRPAQPAISRTEQILISRPIADGWARSTAIRVWLDGTWHSSGEDERLGIVLWPPNVIATGPDRDDRAEQIALPDFLDTDLGPGGAFVSRWGGDATRDGATPAGPLLLPATFGYDSNASHKTLTFVRRAWMPVASEPLIGGGPVDPDERTAKPADQLAVALLTLEPTLCPDKKCWYADLQIDTGQFPRPRIRLALVRYQEHAREDDAPLDGEEPVRLRVSTPVRTFVQPLPSRTATAVVQAERNEPVRITGTLRGVAATRLDDRAGRVVVEMALRRSAPDGRDQPVLDDDGRPLVLLSGDGRDAAVLRTADGAESIWTGQFTLRQGFVPGWRYAVIIREWEEMRPATPAADAPSLVATGDRFLARIAVQP